MDKKELLALLKNVEPFESKVVPGFNGYIRKISGVQRDTLELGFMGPDGRPDMSKIVGHRSRLVAFAFADEDGKTVFTTDEAGDLPNELVTEIYQVARKFNGLAKEDAESTKSTDEEGSETEVSASVGTGAGVVDSAG